MGAKTTSTDSNSAEELEEGPIDPLLTWFSETVRFIYFFCSNYIMKYAISLVLAFLVLLALGAGACGVGYVCTGGYSPLHYPNNYYYYYYTPIYTAGYYTSSYYGPTGYYYYYSAPSYWYYPAPRVYYHAPYYGYYEYSAYYYEPGFYISAGWY